MSVSGAAAGRLSVHRPGTDGVSSAEPDRRLSRHRRIRESRLFREAFEGGRCWPGRLMVLWLLFRDDSSLRLGVVASKRTFRTAVKRARAKRLLREAYRLNRFRLRSECDVVLVGRRAILDASLPEVEKELLKLAGKAGMLREDA
jgi:ribonuclease P protein component